MLTTRQKFFTLEKVMKLKKGDIVILNGSKNATKFEVLDAKGSEVCVKEKDSNYCPQYVGIDRIYTVVDAQ